VFCVIVLPFVDIFVKKYFYIIEVFAEGEIGPFKNTFHPVFVGLRI
jgi:hypothetical protein